MFETHTLKMIRPRTNLDDVNPALEEVSKVLDKCARVDVDSDAMDFVDKQLIYLEHPEGHDQGYSGYGIVRLSTSTGLDTVW